VSIDRVPTPGFPVYARVARIFSIVSPIFTFGVDAPAVRPIVSGPEGSQSFASTSGVSAASSGL
jgi:hypothetical protein